MSVTTSRVGSDLRAARERLGYTLPAIAAHLRIRLPFLEAIEDGRISDLPGNAYAVGFLRTYAQALGLDPDEVARRFRAEAAEVNRKTELDFPAPVPERGIPAGAIVLLGVVIAICAYIGWYRMSGRDHPEAEIVPPVPGRLAALTANPAPQPLPSGATALPSVVPAAPARAPLSGPSSVPTSGAAAPAAGPPLASAQPGAPASSGSSAQVAGPATAKPASPPGQVGLSQVGSGQAGLGVAGNPASVPPAAAAGGAAPADAGRMVLRAKADAWVQVREKGGAVLLNRVLRPGETWPVPPAKAQLLLTTGNAAGTELLVDGVVTASLGGEGAVRRDLLLDPDMAKDGKLAPGVPQAARPVAAPATRTN